MTDSHPLPAPGPYLPPDVADLPPIEGEPEEEGRSAG